MTTVLRTDSSSSIPRSKRAVPEQLLNPLSRKLLENEFKPGDNTKVSADGDELKFQRKPTNYMP